MTKAMMAALAALALAPAVPGAAQTPPPLPPLAGTRLDVTATGQVSRIPDIVRVEAGVVTRAPTAAEAMRQNGERMARVRAALARAGVADRDIQTSSFRLGPAYRTAMGRQEPDGYQASNRLLIRLREIASSGRVLDALVAEGVNDIDGPMLDFSDREAALDEARSQALAAARARADLYARGLGMRVKRAVLVSEEGGSSPRDDLVSVNANLAIGSTIDPGGRQLSATVNVVFELE